MLYLDLVLFEMLQCVSLNHSKYINIQIEYKRLLGFPSWTHFSKITGKVKVIIDKSCSLNKTATVINVQEFK